MLKDFEFRRKGLSKSPVLSYSPHYMNLIKSRRSTSPSRYTANDIQDLKKPFPLQSNKPSKISLLNGQSLETIQKISLTNRNENFKKPPTPKSIKKTSPRSTIPSHRQPTFNISRERDYAQAKSATKTICKNFKFNSSCLKKLENPKSEENIWNNESFRGKNEENIKKNDQNKAKNSSFRSNPRVPLAPFKLQSNGNRSISVEKRKFPARYLKIEVQSSRKSENLQLHYVNDLKILQENNSETLIKDLEAAKLGRMHMKALKKGSILKNVYEEESWHWSSPEASPAKPRRVHFPND